MRLTRKAIALVAAVSAAQVMAANQVATTADLVELCSVTVDDPAYNAAMGFCLGYIDASLDYHAAITAGPNNHPIVCPDVSVTREEVVYVFLRASKTNAGQPDSEAPVEGVMRAIYEKWPCSGQ